MEAHLPKSVILLLTLSTELLAEINHRPGDPEDYFVGPLPSRLPGVIGS